MVSTHPDGRIRYAENPPKRYEDIYPLDFDSANWPGLWAELLGVARFWVAQGVRIFRVDNPHTKPFRFWEWFIASLKAEQPELIFLSEAFTRPKVMYELAKVGFTQSYTYFAWRNEKWELESYFDELTRTEVADYFRPNLWPNTPDILTETLQSGRHVGLRRPSRARGDARRELRHLRARLRAPGARAPASRAPRSTRHSEKYEVRHWDLDPPGQPCRSDRAGERDPPGPPGAAATIGRCASTASTTTRSSPIRSARSVTTPTEAVVGGRQPRPRHTQSGWVELDLCDLGLDQRRTTSCMTF